MVQMRIKKERNVALKKPRLVSAPTVNTMKKMAQVNGWSGSIVNRKGNVVTI